MTTAAKKAPQGVWKTKTISEFAVEGTAAVWRAQLSNSPDGKRFVGIRKYFVKKDGTERADRAGMSILVDDNRLKTLNQLKQLQGLFKGLQVVLNEQPAVAEPPKKHKSKPPKQETYPEVYALYKGDDFLVKCVKNAETGKVAVYTTTSADKAKTWDVEAEAQAYLDARTKSLKGYETCSRS